MLVKKEVSRIRTFFVDLSFRISVPILERDNDRLSNSLQDYYLNTQSEAKTVKLRHLSIAFLLAAAIPTATNAYAEDAPQSSEYRRPGQSGSGPFGAGRLREGGSLGGIAGNGALMKMLPIMVALDTDEDGVLSATEIENAPKSLLKLDKNGDGQLSLEELRPDPSKMANLSGMQGPGQNNPPNAAMMIRMFENRDTDGDGKLTGDEIPERLRERVNFVDTNGDGSIQKAELEDMVERMNNRDGLRPGRGNDKDGKGVTPKRPPE